MKTSRAEWKICWLKGTIEVSTRTSNDLDEKVRSLKSESKTIEEDINKKNAQIIQLTNVISKKTKIQESIKVSLEQKQKELQQLTEEANLAAARKDESDNEYERLRREIERIKLRKM